MKRTLCFILAILVLTAILPFFTPSSLAADGDFIIVDGVLTKYTGSGGAIVIPDGVTSIGGSAFEGNMLITSVKIPGSVTKILSRAFWDCKNLKTVVIDYGLKTISNVAFKYCTSLESINIPDGVTNIGSLAFQDCKSLESFVIPDSVTYIDATFDGCTSLKEVTIGKGLTTIGVWVFRGCESLESVTIPANIKEVKASVFENSAVTTVTFEREDTKIDPRAIVAMPSDMLIRGFSPSTAEVFAKSKGYRFESIGPGTGTYPLGTSGETIIVPSDKSGISINLTEETASLSSFTVAAYSIDGGNKWKKGALPTGTKFAKLFNKEMTLWLCSEIDKKKKPTETAVIVKFPTINARPNAEKMKPFYTDDSWFLTKKGTEDKITQGYEFATSKNKKTADDNLWYLLDNDGFEIGTGKTKTTYLVRSPATKNGGTYTPASKMLKIKPFNYGKAPSLKIDNKTKTLKLKNGHFYQIDDYQSNEITDKTHLVDFNVDKGENVYVWKKGTSKKPPTEKQTISLQAAGISRW